MAPRDVDPWAVATANKGVLVAYVARKFPWACRDAHLYEEVEHVGLILLHKAASTYDGQQTTFAGWACAIFDAQLLHRIREVQGLPPQGSYSLDDNARRPGRDDEDEWRAAGDADFADRRPRTSRAALLAVGVEVRALVAASRDVVARYGPATRRVVLRALYGRAWGRVGRRDALGALAMRHGVPPGELDKLDRAWRPEYYANR